jgi:hypothetical protein
MKGEEMKFFFNVFLVIFMLSIYSCQSTNSTNKFSTLLGNEKIILNRVGKYNNENLRAIIYYVPFNVLTRYPLTIDDVKIICDKKIEILEVNQIYYFLKDIENKTYTIKNYDYLNLRCVIEFFHNDTLIFSYSSETGKNIIIDNNMINNENEYIIFMNNYLFE